MLPSLAAADFQKPKTGSWGPTGRAAGDRQAHLTLRVKILKRNTEVSLVSAVGLNLLEGSFLHKRHVGTRSVESHLLQPGCASRALFRLLELAGISQTLREKLVWRELSSTTW